MIVDVVVSAVVTAVYSAAVARAVVLFERVVSVIEEPLFTDIVVGMSGTVVLSTGVITVITGVLV